MILPKNWEWRVIVLSSFTLLLFAFLIYRGLRFDSVIFSSKLEIKILIGFLSLFHASVFSIVYRKINKANLSTKPEWVFLTKKHILSHFAFAGAASVLLFSIVNKYYHLSLSGSLVIMSYLLGVIFMFCCFLILVKNSKRRFFHEICSNFVVLINSYFVLGAVFYEHTFIAKFMIDWYPFGNLLLNF